MFLLQLKNSISRVNPIFSRWFVYIPKNNMKRLNVKSIEKIKKNKEKRSKFLKMIIYSHNINDFV